MIFGERRKMIKIFASSASGWGLETRKANLLLEMKNGRPVVSCDSPLLIPSNQY